MAKQYKVLVNTGKEENNKAVDVQQFSGDKGQPVRIKAQAGAKYQLQEVARGKNVGPDYVKAKVTPPGGGTPVVSDGTPFTIDTTPPTVLVSSDKTTLTTGQTATITFTLSEDSKDFTLNDVTTEGGTLSNLQGSGKVYTATFTPSANSTTTSTVKVDSLKFSDAAGNFNQDGADTGVTNTNIVSMATNTTAPDAVRPTIASLAMTLESSSPVCPAPASSPVWPALPLSPVWPALPSSRGCKPWRSSSCSTSLTLSLSTWA